MLKSTLQLIKGVSAEKEKHLWHSGITTWDDYEAKKSNPTPYLFGDMEDSIATELQECRRALRDTDIGFFSTHINRLLLYRIALSFPQDVMFLDIETTGLSRYYDKVTLVGWCLGNNFDVLIQGGNNKNLKSAAKKARILVTFNGTLFDLPFLRLAFPDIHFPDVHLDLRFLAKRVGLTGGQKSIETVLGLKRPNDLKGMEGESAPVLWHQYRKGDVGALKTLIEYNHADIEGMKFILDEVITRFLDRDGVPNTLAATFPKFAVPSIIKWASTINKNTAASGIRIPRYRGKKGPQVSLKQMMDEFPPLKNFRCVGIDLTGAETKPSGWCFLLNGKAETRSICSDDELVAATVAMNPAVVSIDSPLSLPEGRTSVYDDDPNRKYGIMRYCERVLKKRGINVYPALIQSMQKLTERGMKLAEIFRKKGIPVIESYPGAAQDIMSIPRKQNGLDLLIEGLTEFGVRGAFEKTPVTHDELDAITSAVVAVFFWAGRFEALGKDSENYLIIPDLKVDPTGWRNRIVIGLSGCMAAGKTTAARHLEENGFKYTRYSMVIEQELREKNLPVDRKHLQELGEDIHKNRGQRWLGRTLVKLVGDANRIVIDGLRFPEDHAFLREAFGPAFFHRYIDATEDVRRSRYEARPDQHGSFDAAQIHPVESKVPELKPLAISVITNDGSMSDFFEKINLYSKG